jgi:hypothetical protein
VSYENRAAGNKRGWLEPFHVARYDWLYADTCTKPRYRLHRSLPNCLQRKGSKLFCQETRPHPIRRTYPWQLLQRPD